VRDRSAEGGGILRQNSQVGGNIEGLLKQDLRDNEAWYSLKLREKEEVLSEDSQFKKGGKKKGLLGVKSSKRMKR